MFVYSKLYIKDLLDTRQCVKFFRDFEDELYLNAPNLKES